MSQKRRCFIMSRRRRKYVNTEAPEVDLLDDDFAENMHAFLRDLKMRDRSPYTIKYYEVELSKFMHTIEDMRLNTRLRTITDALIRDEYVRNMYEERRVKHASVAASLRALRAFFNWAVNRGVIEYSPMDNVTIGDRKTPTIEMFSRDQFRTLFSQPDCKQFVGV